MNSRRAYKPVQTMSHSEGERAYERLQSEIQRKEGVECSVVVFPDRVSIRTATYADFLLAKRAIKGSVNLPICRDE